MSHVPYLILILYIRKLYSNTLSPTSFCIFQVLVVSRSAIFQATEIIQTGIKQGLVVVKKVRIVNGNENSLSATS